MASTKALFNAADKVYQFLQLNAAGKVYQILQLAIQHANDNNITHCNSQ